MIWNKPLKLCCMNYLIINTAHNIQYLKATFVKPKLSYFVNIARLQIIVIHNINVHISEFIYLC